MRSSETTSLADAFSPTFGIRTVRIRATGKATSRHFVLIYLGREGAPNPGVKSAPYVSR